MNRNQFSSRTAVLIAVVVAVAIGRTPAVAADAPQRIGPTTPPLIQLPFGLQWTHSPFEAVEVLKKIPGVTEIRAGSRDLFSMTPEEIREVLTNDLRAQRYEYWDMPITEDSLSIIVRPIMIQQVTCELELWWEAKRGLIVVDPERVNYVKSSKQTDPDEIAWPVFLVGAEINNNDRVPVAAQAIDSLGAAIISRHQATVRACVERWIDYKVANAQKDNVREYAQRYVGTAVFRAYIESATNLQRRAKDSSHAREGYNALYEALDPYKSANRRFCVGSEGDIADFNHSLLYTPFNAISCVLSSSEFSLEYSEPVAWFSCRSSSSGSSGTIWLEYKRSDTYSQMLAAAAKSFVEQAEARVRESRKAAPDLSGEL